MASGIKVFLTGATGFVGSAVANKLAVEGFEIRALTRPGSPRAHLDGAIIDFVEGDMRDAESIRRGMAGVRYVFHVAADYRLWARDRSEIVANNVEGTRIIMQEAMRAGVDRVVYTSSVATLGWPRDGAPGTEDIPLSEQQGIGAYKRSKIAAERLVEAMVANDGLPAVIVNPSTPIGPRDVKPTPTGRIIVEAASGRIPGFVDTGLNLVHVDDVADGHLAALQRGVIGQRYILGGQDVLLADMLADIANSGWTPAAALAHSARRGRAGCLCCRGDRALHRPRTAGDARRVAYVRAPHVLQRGESRTRARLSRPALSRSARRRDQVVWCGRLLELAVG